MKHKAFKILVIDDENVMQSFLERALTDFGFDVTLASTGQQGLACYRQLLFDLVLIDLGLVSAQ